MGKTNELRRQILTFRDAIPETLRHEYSDRIAEKILSLDVLRRATVIFLYVSFRSEVETKDLLHTLLSMGKRVLVPLTLVAEHKMLAIPICDPDRELRAGYCGIPEPFLSQSPCAVDPSVIDLVLLPGSVFDERGGRLGYGGGFYDRFVGQEAPQALRLGLAYDRQVVSQISLAPHDQLVDFLITEERIIASQARANRKLRHNISLGEQACAQQPF